MLAVESSEIWGLNSSEFLQLLEDLQRNAKTEDEGYNLVTLAVKERCKVDVELFAIYYFPHYCELAFNQIHRDSFGSFRFGARGLRSAMAAPRGYAKSTFAVLIEPLHDICYQNEHYIIIISNTEDQAALKVKDIRTEILTNDLLTNDFGINFETKKPAALSFIVRSGDYRCKVQAVGQNTELRGIRFGSYRPTKIVADDYEHSEKSQKEYLREKERNKFFEVVTKLGNPQTNLKFVGTILHRDSLLSHLLANPAYKSHKYKAVISWADRKDLWNQWERIYCDLDNDQRQEEARSFYQANKGAMLQGVEVLWPEKEDYYYLMCERIESGHRAFMKEKQNDPINDEYATFTEFSYFSEVPEGLKIEKSGLVMPWKHLHHQCYGAIDPSAGKGNKGKGKLPDFTSIPVGYKDSKGRLLVYSDWTKRAAPSKWIDAMFDLEESKAEGFCKFGVETNMYRELLLPNLVEERKRREAERKKIVKIPFYDIVQTENKEARIFTLEPKIEHGWILFNRTISDTAMNQFLDFPKGDHDDFPDSIEMLWGLINNRYKAAPVSKQVTMR